MTYTQILTQIRALARVDSTQWSDAKITLSTNNWMDKVVGYAIGADRRFRFDSTNHTKMPIGTTNINANQSQYSFLTDEQGNRILTLTGISRVVDGKETALTPVDFTDDRNKINGMRETPGTPMYYDKVSDNVIELLPTPDTTISGGLKFYFQRSPKYFLSNDTTTESGFATTLDRGFVIAGAYDAALALGLPNLQPLSVELARCEADLKQYFDNRNEDEPAEVRPIVRNYR
jgi:hypothetical protein